MLRATAFPEGLAAVSLDPQADTPKPHGEVPQAKAQKRLRHHLHTLHPEVLIVILKIFAADISWSRKKGA